MEQAAPQTTLVQTHDDRIQLRRTRLVAIASLWERQLCQLEDAAYIHFRDQNLSKISELIAQKRGLERKLAQLRGFLQHRDE